MKDPARSHIALTCFALGIEALGFLVLVPFVASFACGLGEAARAGDFCSNAHGHEWFVEVVATGLALQIGVIVLACRTAMSTSSYGPVTAAALVVHVIPLLVCSLSA